MLRWTLLFLVLTVAAAALGYSSLASMWAGLFVAFLLGWLAPTALHLPSRPRQPLAGVKQSPSPRMADKS